jgi:peptidylprolyl isomerase
MRIKTISISLLIFITISQFVGYAQVEKTGETHIIMETSMGKIKVKLYNQTPLHRDNFIKLVQSKFYEGIIFHRVISKFMIQTGDPDSKTAKPDAILGNGGPGYNIPAEIVPDLFHKRGALAAARLGDNVNPKKESSGSQFYIVQGEVLSADQIKNMEDRLKYQKKQELFFAEMNKPENSRVKHQFDSLRMAKNTYAANQIAAELGKKLQSNYAVIDAGSIFTEEQKKIYSTIGGTPHLDGGYTVFGEVVEGMDVVDAISATEKGANDRPKKDIKILKMTIVN